MTVCDSGLDFCGNQPKSTNALNEWLQQSPSSNVMDPKMPIVDAHHHLFGGQDDTHYYRMADLQRDVSGGHQIIGTVYVEAYKSGWRSTGPEALQPVGEVEMIVGLTESLRTTASGHCQVAAAIVCHADLTLGHGVEEVLQKHLSVARGRLRGVRHRTATVDGTVGRMTVDKRKPKLLLDSEFRRGFALLSSLNLSFDAWVYHPQLDELIDVADAFPSTKIVVNHIGAPLGVAEFRRDRAQVLREWEYGMRELAKRPNVLVKVGGMGMPILGFGFEHRDRPATAGEMAQAWKPFIDFCVDTFGSSRCMFESNSPVDKQSGHYCDIWNAFKLATEMRSLQERTDLFYRTACRAYRLPDLESLGDKMAGNR